MHRNCRLESLAGKSCRGCPEIDCDTSGKSRTDCTRQYRPYIKQINPYFPIVLVLSGTPKFSTFVPLCPSRCWGIVETVQEITQMELSRATAILIEKMTQHGLFAKGWQAGWHNKKRTLGTCSYRHKTIFLSRPLTELNSEETITDTILHEIAHALAPADANHGLAWKLVAQSIGARPELCANNAVQVRGRWEAVCPTCGYTRQHHRRPTKERSCGVCCPYFNREFLMVVRETR